MTETELAQRLGMPQSYLNVIASGKKNVTLEVLERIAEGLGMTLHVCFDENDLTFTEKQVDTNPENISADSALSRRKCVSLHRRIIK